MGFVASCGYHVLFTGRPGLVTCARWQDAVGLPAGCHGFMQCDDVGMRPNQPVLSQFVFPLYISVYASNGVIE